MFTPRAYAFDDNKIPVITAGLILLACPVSKTALTLAGLTLAGAYVVGPLAGYLLWLANVTVDDAIVELPHEGDAP